MSRKQPLYISRRQIVTGMVTALAAPSILLHPANAADYPPTEGEMQEFVLYKHRTTAPQEPFMNRDLIEQRFSDYRGIVVLVNFWATWCPPCIKEMPSLHRLAQFFEGQAFRFLAISQDRKADQVVHPFLNDRLNLPDLNVAYDPKMRLSRAMKMRVLPSTYLIDAQGGIVGALRGPAEWDSPGARALIRHVISESV